MLATPPLVITSLLCQPPGGGGGGQAAVAYLTICLGGLGVSGGSWAAGAVIGAPVGAIAAHGAAEVDAADAALKHAIGDVDPRAIIQDRLVARGNGKTVDRFIPYDMFQSDMPYPTLVHDGVDGVIEIHFDILALVGKGNFAPGVWVIMAARARLIRLSDRAVLIERAWQYQGYRIDYFDMAADDAALFHFEFRQGCEELADAMVNDLFVTNSDIKSVEGREMDWGELRRVPLLPQPAQGALVQTTGVPTFAEGAIPKSEMTAPPAAPP